MRRLAWLAGLALALGALPAASPPSHAQTLAPASEADLTDFYRHPSPALLGQIIVFLDHLPEARMRVAAPAAYGFLAGALRRYPANLDQIIPANLSPQGLRVVAIGLHLAGQYDRADAMAARLAAQGGGALNMARMPASLDTVPAEDPKLFDLLWGASFATGDGQYCAKILAAYAAVANRDANAADLLTIARGHGRDQDAIKAIVQRRGIDTARLLINMSSALWSLHANAQQHDFVRAVVMAYVQAHPREPAALALLTF